MNENLTTSESEDNHRGKRTLGNMLYTAKVGYKFPNTEVSNVAKKSQPILIYKNVHNATDLK